MGVIEELDGYKVYQVKLENLVMTVQTEIFRNLESKKQLAYDTLILDTAEMRRIKPREAKKIIDLVLDNCQTLEYDGTMIKIRKG